MKELGVSKQRWVQKFFTEIEGERDSLFLLDGPPGTGYQLGGANKMGPYFPTPAIPTSKGILCEPNLWDPRGLPQEVWASFTPFWRVFHRKGKIPPKKRQPRECGDYRAPFYRGRHRTANFEKR